MTRDEKYEWFEAENDPRLGCLSCGALPDNAGERHHRTGCDYVAWKAGEGEDLTDRFRALDLPPA